MTGSCRTPHLESAAFVIDAPHGVRSAWRPCARRVKGAVQMLDEATIAIITGATGNIVAYMLNGHADAARAWVSRIFRAGGEGQQSAPLRRIEEDSAALLQGTATESEIRARWSVLLTSLLAANPELRTEVSAFATAPVPASVVNLGSQNNYGPGPFIAGHNFGSIGSASERGGQ